MDIQSVAAIVGMSTGSLSLALQSYSALFKKSNLEKLAETLIQSGKDLSLIGKREDLQRYFLAVLDTAANEANSEKIEVWKNVITHMATDFADWPYKENYIKVLETLTVFDLVVLHRIYEVNTLNANKPNNTPSDNVKKQLFHYFVAMGVPEGVVRQSMNRLFANGLVDQTSTWDEFLADKANETGADFLRFISE